MSGSVPNVRFADSRLLGGFGRGWFKVSSREYRTVRVRDEGRETDTCSAISVTAPRGMYPTIVRVASKATLYPFSSLTADLVCDDLLTPNRGLPSVPVPLKVKASMVGDKVIRVPFNRTVPVESCPDYAGPEHSRECDYTLAGTLTLRLVPDIDVFEAPTKARLAKAAASASVVAGCSAACTATLTVRPLKGAGSASTRETLRPRKAETLSVKLNKRLSRAVLKSGGARLEVTYRNSGGTRTFSKTVRR
jgi:hypothetical protein